MFRPRNEAFPAITSSQRRLGARAANIRTAVDAANPRRARKPKAAWALHRNQLIVRRRPREELKQAKRPVSTDRIGVANYGER